MRLSHVNLVLIKRNEDLNSLVKFLYSVRGQVIGYEKRQATTKSLVYSVISSKCKILSPNIEDILATHLDKYQEMMNRVESLSDEEKELEKLL